MTKPYVVNEWTIKGIKMHPGECEREDSGNKKLVSMILFHHKTKTQEKFL